MKQISQIKPQVVKVESMIKWPKCDFCGFCHPDNESKCPRMQSFDRNFGSRRK